MYLKVHLYPNRNVETNEFLDDTQSMGDRIVQIKSSRCSFSNFLLGLNVFRKNNLLFIPRSLEHKNCRCIQVSST